LVTDSADPVLAPVHPELKAAANDVAHTLEALGHHVEPGPPVVLDVEEFLLLWRRTAAWAPLPRVLEGRLQGVTRWLRETGRAVSPEAAFAHKAALEGRIDAWWGDVDLVVTPTVTTLAPPVGSWRHPDPATSFSRAVPLGAFTAVFNVSGQPGITVPVWREGQPLPLAVQIVARRDDDARLLALARVLEEARGGFDRRPPAWAG
jgi:amidase